MRNLTGTICLTTIVLFGSVGEVWNADFLKVKGAYHNGDYATALSELEPLAEQYLYRLHPVVQGL